METLFEFLAVVSGIGLVLAATSGRRQAASAVLLFLFGFFLAMAWGEGFFHWLGIRLDQGQAQQPPGKLGGGS